jgi:hypothetical protein
MLVSLLAPGSGAVFLFLFVSSSDYLYFRLPRVANLKKIQAVLCTEVLSL